MTAFEDFIIEGTTDSTLDSLGPHTDVWYNELYITILPTELVAGDGKTFIHCDSSLTEVVKYRACKENVTAFYNVIALDDVATPTAKFLGTLIPSSGSQPVDGQVRLQVVRPRPEGYQGKALVDVKEKYVKDALGPPVKYRGSEWMEATFEKAMRAFAGAPKTTQYKPVRVTDRVAYCPKVCRRPPDGRKTQVIELGKILKYSI